VSPATLTAALKPTDCITFASPKTQAHSGLTGFGVLEGQSHHRVHNNVGGIITVTGPDGKPVTTFGQGFMQANLSPVDPLFFLHHANIDRIWDVWTRKQQALGLPILPDGYLLPPGAPPMRGTDYFNWSQEPFLFFVDVEGQPVGKTTARDYESIGDFNYEYEPGTGEGVVPQQVAAAAPRALSAPAPRFSAQIGNPTGTRSAPRRAGSSPSRRRSSRRAGRTLRLCWPRSLSGFHRWRIRATSRSWWTPRGAAPALDR
jgi:hypothetical protein